jgi:hypothetical protein
MRISEIFPFAYQKDVSTPTLLQWFRKHLARLGACLNGGLTFGDGVDPDNIHGCWKTIADTGLANTDFAVAHTGGAVPVGFILMVPPAAGFIYKGGAAWTSTQIFLKCSVANQAVTVFVVFKSQGPQA